MELKFLKLKNKILITAFTLIELLVVVSIISLLSSIVFASISTASDRAEVAAGLQFENQVHKKLYNCLVAQYDFEDTSNLGLDSSGYDNHATNGGAISAFGVNGGMGVQFDGGLRHLKTPEIEINTISLWVYKLPGSFGSEYFFDGRDGGGTSYVYTGGTPSTWRQRYINGVRDDGLTWDDIPEEKWTHLMYTYYINFEDDLNIGSRYVNTESLNGYIDDFKIYNCGI